METLDKWSAVFTNDPNNDYALIMEISYEEEVFGIVHQSAGSLVIDFYPVSPPVTVPLDWLIDRLETARIDLSKEGTQSESL